MGWTWRLEANDGREIDQSQVPTFDSQADAETWIGERWQQLLADGVDSVDLLEDGELIYDNMSLHPPA